LTSSDTGGSGPGAADGADQPPTGRTPHRSSLARHRHRAKETAATRMRLRALLDTDALGLKLLGGEDELDRGVRGVMTTDLRDPSRYLSGGELVLTGLAWRRDAADSEPFV